MKVADFEFVPKIDLVGPFFSLKACGKKSDKTWWRKNHKYMLYDE